MDQGNPHVTPLTGAPDPGAEMRPGVRVLITGAGGSAAYNFLDALRQAPVAHDCVGTDVAPQHLELLPVRRRYLNPGLRDEDAYIAALNRIVELEGIELIHPQPDVEVAFLARNRDHLDAPVFLPSQDTVELCQDKMAFNEAMVAADVPVPRSHHVTGRDGLAAALDDLLLSGNRVWLRAIRGAGSRASLPVTSLYQADAWIDYWRVVRGLRYDDFMASELLPGAEFAWQSLWHDGELVTSQARERVAYIFGNLTPSGQTSSPSVARTVSRADVNRIGEAAVRAASASPHGVFCVDLKENWDGVPCVTEINAGRFFTTSNFFAHAGLNMPDMYLRLGVGETLAQTPPRHDPLPADLYWVRMIDMGYRLVPGGQWSSLPVDMGEDEVRDRLVA